MSLYIFPLQSIVFFVVFYVLVKKTLSLHLIFFPSQFLLNFKSVKPCHTANHANVTQEKAIYPPSFHSIKWRLDVCFSLLPSAYFTMPSFALVFKANSLFSLFMDGPSELN